MQRVSVTSSVLVSVGHVRGVLEVEFVGGAVYRYVGVPEHVYVHLLNADSLGTYFNDHIRDSYDYERVS